MAAFPITREDSSLGGVVLASIRMEWIAEFARTVARRPGYFGTRDRRERHGERKLYR
jgi:hypothetical protein